MGGVAGVQSPYQADVWCSRSAGQGAELPMALELAVSHAASLLCLHSDLEGPFS